MELEFPRFLELPDHIQIEVMTNCLPKTRMMLSETCKHLNRLLWTSPHLVKRIRLNIRLHHKLKRQKLIDNLDVLLKNRENGRKYRKVKVYFYKSSLNPILKAKFMETINFLGTSVTGLSLNLYRIHSHDLVEFLRQFPILDNLMLDGFDGAFYSSTERILNTQGLLPKLHTLNVDFPDSSILEIVKDINTLESFTFQVYESDNETVLKFGIVNLEDFIIKQNRLKKLKIYGTQRFPLFEVDRFDEINFQLESLKAGCFFIHRKNAAKFFKRQQSIKNVHLIDFMHFGAFDRLSYTNILHTIFGLPNLEKVTIGPANVIPEDFELLSDIRNKSVKKVKYWKDDTTVMANFLKIFPNLKKLQCVQQLNVPLNFSAFPYDKLEIVSERNLLTMLSFTPSVIEGDVEKFENAIINFLKRHRDVKVLTIGHKDWIGTSHTVSLNCLKQVVEIAKKLLRIEIYNPHQLDESLTLLNNIKIHRLHI